MNSTKFWLTSLASIAAAGTLGLAIAQNTSDQKMDQGGSTAGGAAKEEPAAPAASSTTSTTASSESSSTSTPAAEQPVAKADRG